MEQHLTDSKEDAVLVVDNGVCRVFVVGTEDARLVVRDVRNRTIVSLNETELEAIADAYDDVCWSKTETHRARKEAER